MESGAGVGFGRLRGGLPSPDRDGTPTVGSSLEDGDPFGRDHVPDLDGLVRGDPGAGQGCRYCVSGWETLCQSQVNSGYSADGCYAEYAVADAGAVVQAAMAGFVLDETALIVAGMLVSASGGILTKPMADVAGPLDRQGRRRTWAVNPPVKCGPRTSWPRSPGASP
jgi:hypothetical protein